MLPSIARKKEAPPLLRYQKQKHRHLKNKPGVSVSLPHIAEFVNSQKHIDRVMQILKTKDAKVIIDENVRLNHNSLVGYSKLIKRDKQLETEV